jgi:hypothetical protein
VTTVRKVANSDDSAYTVGLPSDYIALDVFAEIVFPWTCILLQWVKIGAEVIQTGYCSLQNREATFLQQLTLVLWTSISESPYPRCSD